MWTMNYVFAPIQPEDIIGLKPGNLGWPEVKFTPNIPESLEYVSLEINTAKGKIKVEYKNSAASIQVPEGIKLMY